MGCLTPESQLLQRWEYINSGTPERDMNLFDDIGMDVLDVMECCIEVEETLSDKAEKPIHITTEDADSIQTVGDLIDVAKGAISK